MAHDCTDWTTKPPTRKTPLLILSRGDDHVYTIVPKEFQTLKDVARREFGLGDVDLHVFSSCANLCNGLPARITESAWEHVSSYIGCATVAVVNPRVVESRAVKEQQQGSNAVDEHDVDANTRLPLDADEPRRGGSSVSAREAVAEEEDASSDHEKDHDRASASDNHDKEPEEEEEEVSAIFSRKPRRQRHMSSEDDEDGDESEREHETPARSQASDVTSQKLSGQPRDEPDYKPGKEIKKKRQDDHYSKPVSEQNKLIIKRERRDSGDASNLQPRTESQTEAHKLMIRVAHRPSRQESKFTMKSATKVSKVLSGACKSFGLAATRATLYLIVSTEDEDGEVENLFPCDKDDTIERAGAERDTESRFLLKIAGEA